MTDNEARAQAAAEEVRAELALGTAPIGDVFDFLHRLDGIDAMSINAAGHEHGLTAPVLDGHLIIVAASDRPMRMRSSAMHELGHVRLGHLTDESADLDPGYRTDEEIQADSFARHLLLPLGEVNRRCADQRDQRAPLEVLSDLSQDYGVSPAIAAIQMRDAGYITSADASDYMRWSTPGIAAAYGWAGQYAAMQEASRTPRAPQRLTRKIVQGFDRGLVTRDEVRSWYPSGADELPEPTLPSPAVYDDGVDGDAFG